MQQIAQAAAAFGIDHGGDDFGRLVQDQVGALGFGLQQLALHLDVIFGFVGLGAEFGDGGSVHGDHSGGDQFFGVAARGDSSARDDFLQSFEHRSEYLPSVY